MLQVWRPNLVQQGRWEVPEIQTDSKVVATGSLRQVDRVRSPRGTKWRQAVLGDPESGRATLTLKYPRTRTQDGDGNQIAIDGQYHGQLSTLVPQGNELVLETQQMPVWFLLAA